jgi:hypothetical protein
MGGGHTDSARCRIIQWASPRHQHAAQSLVAGPRDDAEPDLAGGGMILRLGVDLVDLHPQLRIFLGLNGE